MREREIATREELFELAFPTLDLFDFSKMLVKIRPELTKYFGSREIEYLDALTFELGDWNRAKKWSSHDLEDRISGCLQSNSSYLSPRANRIPPTRIRRL